MTWRKGNRLRLVPEADAQGRTREVFEEMKQALGLPQITIVHQAYAAYPVFLDLHWRALRPAVLTQDFFELAERLRADSYTRVFNYLRVPDLCSDTSNDVRRQITAVVDLLQYKNPLLVLMVAAQYQSFEAPVGREDRTTIHPAEHLVFTEAPQLVEERTTDPELRSRLEDIRRTIGLPWVSYDFRALAHWPQFFANYWDALKRLRESPIYEASQHLLRETAWTLARELPQTVDLSVAQLAEAGMSDEDITSVVRITEMFMQSLTGLLLNVSVARIGLEGGTGAPATPEPRPTEAARPAATDKGQAA